MCGINGFTWPDEGLIRAMNDALRYRGPDDRGVYLDERVSLGTTRLSIIDLSASGHQPMSNEDGTIWITYNGEIYNFQDIRKELIDTGHKFKSRTDSEVLVHAYESYGLDFLNRLNGMWGFGLYDKRKGLLILCRDRYGIKPLYYAINGQRLIFSSMITGILKHAVDAVPNDRAIMEYLAFNLEQHDTYTFFAGIDSLPPGHLLVYDIEKQSHRIQRWYHPTARSANRPEVLKESFVESVRSRTVSDVPIGVCLSGGVDSTAITCVLDQFLSDQFKTYSLVAPGFPVDESKYIKEVGRLTNTSQFFTTVTATDFLADVRDFVVAMEEPVTGLSAYAQYKVFKLAHEQGAKVLLDGQGGDELFAGYVYYFGYLFYELFSRLKWYALARELYFSYRKLGSLFPHAMFLFLLSPRWLRDSVWKSKIVAWVDHKFLDRICEGQRDPRWARMTVKESLSKTLYSTSIPHNLMWEDKSSMRWSVESRVPFLDVAVVETALGLGPEDLLKDGETKRIFKQAIEENLPEMIRERKDKIGFQVPEDDFFRSEPVIDFARKIIYSESFKRRPYWKWDVVEKLFLEHVNGKSNMGSVIWKWINLEIWLREFFES